MKPVWLCFMNSPIWLPVRAMQPPAGIRRYFFTYLLRDREPTSAP
jgi:hypothetical protein